MIDAVFFFWLFVFLLFFVNYLVYTKSNVNIFFAFKSHLCNVKKLVSNVSKMTDPPRLANATWGSV